MPAPDFTKAQIDALVAKMNHEHTDGRVDDWTRLGVGPGSNVVHRHNLTTALYLAAGLTAEGETPRRPMPTTQGYAIVGMPEGDLCVHWRTGGSTPHSRTPSTAVRPRLSREWNRPAGWRGSRFGSSQNDRIGQNARPLAKRGTYSGATKRCRRNARDSGRRREKPE